MEKFGSCDDIEIDGRVLPCNIISTQIPKVKLPRNLIYIYYTLKVTMNLIQNETIKISLDKLENYKSLINILHIFGNDMENTVCDIMYFIKTVEDCTSACKLRWSILQDIL